MDSPHDAVAANTGLIAPPLNEVLAICPYRTIIARRVPAPITFVLQPFGGDPLPIPDQLLRDLMARFHRGEAILLIAQKRAVRDRLKAALLAMLYDKGGRA